MSDRPDLDGPVPPGPGHPPSSDYVRRSDRAQPWLLLASVLLLVAAVALTVWLGGGDT